MSSGKELWKTELKATYRGGINPDVGPRCVPTLTDDSIVIYSASGDLQRVGTQDRCGCMDEVVTKTVLRGRWLLWSSSTRSFFDGKIVVNVGGKVSVRSLLIDQGWQSPMDRIPRRGKLRFANPLPSKIRQRQADLIVPTRLTTVGLDPYSGAERWKVPFGQRGPRSMQRHPSS